MMTTSTNEAAEQEARRAYMASFQAFETTDEVLKYRWPTQPSLGHFTAPESPGGCEPLDLPPVPAEHLPRFHGASRRKNFLPSRRGLQGYDGFQRAVDSRRAGPGAPGGTGVGLTPDRAACALPTPASYAPTTAATTTSGGEAMVTAEASAGLLGGDGGKEEEVAVAASAAFGARRSRVKSTANNASKPEGPTENDLALLFFRACLAELPPAVAPAAAEQAPESSASSPRSQGGAGDQAALAAAGEQAAEAARGVPAAVLLGALDAQAAALVPAARATGDVNGAPASGRAEIGHSLGGSGAAPAPALSARGKGESSPMRQSAVLQKLQATPPLRGALLATHRVDPSSHGSGEGRAAEGGGGASEGGVAELDWLVFCEAVKDLMKWNAFVI